MTSRGRDVIKQFLYETDIERNFHYDGILQWMRSNYKVPVLSVTVYFIFVMIGPRIMQNRKKYDLRRTLTIWSSVLAIFSTMGFLKILPEVLHYLSEGWHTSVCTFPNDRVMAFWGMLFTFSKFPELGDTVFIVLRKQKLIFLHWYHHITVLLFTWYAISENHAAGRWFTVMNYFVHSVMYTYYAIKCMGFRPYKFCQMAVTILQLAQMFMGCFICAYLFAIVIIQGADCDISRNAVLTGAIMYLSYFVLFLNFFYNAYFKKVSSEAKKK